MKKQKDRFILGGSGNKYQVVGSTGGEETCSSWKNGTCSSTSTRACLLVDNGQPSDFKDGGTNTKYTLC